MPTSELPYGAIKVFIALVGVAGAGSFMMWLGSGSGASSTIRSWEIVRASQQDAISKNSFLEAEILGKKAILLAERLGSSNYRVGVSHDTLGEVLVKEKKFQEATKHFDDAEKILQTNIIRAHDDITRRLLLTDLAWSQQNLGLLEVQEGQVDNAIAHFKKAIANLESCVRDKKDGRIDYFAAHRQVSLMLQLASLNMMKGQLDDAQKWFRKSISLADESFYPAFHMKQAREDFANLLKRQGNLEESAALFSHDQWVKHAEAAELARAEGDFKKAEKNLQEAADSAKRSRATMHLAIISLKKLAKLQLQKGNPAACRETCMEALHVWQTLGAGASSEADYVLGLLYRVTPGKEERKDIQTQRLKVRRDLYGNSDYHVAETESELARLYQETGDSKNALIYANEAYDSFNQMRIKTHGLGVQEMSLGEVLEANALLDKAQTMYSRSLNAQMRRDHKNAAFISNLYQHLASVYEKQGKAFESRNASRESARWRAMLLN
ncbi:MAG: hypothetical protein K2Y39_04460 [Candidatus Obscuribacterales bacterium]|nr:hypothetical protein [Candidatus Obscuribacterales bacterium]